jgi:ABC-2 type transport system permease protein
VTHSVIPSAIRLRPYLALARTALTNSFAYRSALILYAVSKVVLAVALFYLWQAILAAGVDLQSYRLDELKVYLLFGLLTNLVLSFTAEMRIARKVWDGSIALDLLKPLDFQATCLAESIGIGLFEGLLSAVIILAVALSYGGVPLASDPSIWALTLLSLALGLMTKFGIVYLTGMLCFWTQSALGISWMRQAVTNLLSGALIPITFFPDWLATLAAWMPFQAIVHIPAQIYLGRAAGPEALRLIGVQILWAVLLILAGRLLWRWAIRQITIEGG